jgi:DNA-directed RNA polymerase specialized sigma24 family protein
VTKLICQVKKGDAAAAQDLFARYFRRLLGLARAKLQGKDLRVADEEDVVNSALAGFFLGAERGQYTKLHDRDDLWHLLVKITVRKAQRLVQEQERQKRCPRRAGRGTLSHGLAGTPLVDAAVEQIADRKPPPDLEVLANEAIDHLLSRLRNTRLRSLAVWKWQGYSNEEIASMLGCSPRTITRKLELIRTIWNEEGARCEACSGCLSLFSGG